MKQKQSEELRQHYIKHPPEGMTSDLLDMHYFLTKKMALMTMVSKKVFISTFFIHLFFPIQSFLWNVFFRSPPNGRLSYYIK